MPSFEANRCRTFVTGVLELVLYKCMPLFQLWKLLCLVNPRNFFLFSSSGDVGSLILVPAGPCYWNGRRIWEIWGFCIPPCCCRFCPGSSIRLFCWSDDAVSGEWFIFVFGMDDFLLTWDFHLIVCLFSNDCITNKRLQ